MKASRPPSLRSRLPALAGLSILLSLLAAGCNEKVAEPEPFEPAASDTARDVFAYKVAETADTARDVPADTAMTGRYTYYSLATGGIVSQADSATDKWDLAFNGTSIRVNGGALVVNNAEFDSVVTAPETVYPTDAATALAIPTGSGNGWYLYNGATSAITPKSRVVIVLKTGGGKYAKVEILGYYKGNPVIGSTTPTEKSRFYTFRYFLQADGSRNLSPNTAPYAYFSLRTGTSVTDTSTGWDLAFRATSVKVNGESQLLSATDFDTLSQAPVSGYGDGATALKWYDYSGEPNHTISPRLATVLVLKTADGKYAKLQYLSYYKGAPANPNGTQLDSVSRNYTFRYFLQTDGSRTLR